MYYDYQVYAPVVAPQIMARPSLISTGQLFQVISIALDRNLNAFLQEKKQKRALLEQEDLARLSKAKTSETVVINLESEEEMEEPVVILQKDVQSNIVKFSPVHETVLDTNHKEEILGAEEIQSISQTSLKSEKEKSPLQKLEPEEKILSLICSKKLESYDDFTLFSIECPKLGISNAQLLRKREKLLRRKVTDWSEVDYKGPKQRRQIRMLKN